ncbi:MAG: DUF2339 domain-containing protein [Bacteroidia bacterium]
MWEFFVVAVVFGLMRWLKNEMQSSFFKISQQLEELKRELKRIREEKPAVKEQEFKEPIAKPEPQPEVKVTPPPVTQPTVIVTPPPIAKPEEKEEEKGTDARPIILSEELGVFETKVPDEKKKEEEKISLSEKLDELETALHIDAPQSSKPWQPQQEKRPKSKSFFEQHPDMEKFIGENLINKIGIAILVLGIAFFVKYAIDQNWINEIGRTCIGLFAGGILIGIAHRMRKSYKAFSSVLIGGGLAVLYFTITIAFQQYHLFSQTAGFAVMVVITAFAVLLSIAYDRMELAVLAIIGGFATPFMVSTGEGNYKVLFTYLMILNVGMLVLAFRKKWNLINIVCYVFTIILFGSWLTNKCLNMPNAPYTGALFFATLFYITFFLMNILYNIRKQEKFKPLEFTILLSNTALYYAAGMGILHCINNGMYQGLFTALLGVFNFAFAFTLYKKQTVDRNLVFLLIGMVLTFLSLAAPVQLEGNYITMFWSAEAVLLLWLSQKSQIKLMKIASVIVLGLMLFSLFMDWSQLYHDHIHKLAILVNKAFITSAASLAAVYLVWRLLKNETENYFIDSGFKVDWYKNILQVLMVAMLYATLGLELDYQLREYVEFYQCRNIVLAFYNFKFVAALIWLTKKNENHLLLNVKIALASICVVSYIFFFNNSIIEVRNDYLTLDSSEAFFFYFHFCLTIVLIYLVMQWKILTEKFIPNISNGIQWITTFLFVFIASAELDHIITVISFSSGSDINHIIIQNHKIGYPVLWGMFSFVLMQLGMKNKNRSLRIMSLTLFAITILKLFIYDIRDVSEGGKIVAFIALGVLLLIVSFMYQRLKKLILDDEKKVADSHTSPQQENEL